MDCAQNNSFFLKLAITIAIIFGIGIVSAISLLQQVYAGLSAGSSSSSIRADFNGDGRDDLAIGVPGENVDFITDAGAVNVIYGSPSGLTAVNNQIWDQNSPNIQSGSESDEFFGRHLTQ